MTKRITGAITALVLAAATSGLAAKADANRCGLQTLRGRYVFTASGFVINPATGAAQPKAIAEVAEFNGDGTVSVTAATRSVNGVIIRSLPGLYVYTLADDCAGTITFDGPTFDMFAAPRGNQFWLIQTNPNNVFEGAGTRTSREDSDRDSR